LDCGSFSAALGPDSLGEGPVRGGAFTLIELLVVIAIIAILAGLLLPAAVGVKNKAAIKRVEGQLAQVEQAIATYKIDKGFYPPDRKVANNPVVVQPFPNALFYELSGANIQADRQTFLTLDGGDVATAPQLQAAFGTGGISNAGVDGNTEGPAAKNYLMDIKPAQYAVVDFKGAAGLLKVLRTDVDGPVLPLPFGSAVNPFRYVSTNPTNNPSSFDLWVDVIIAGKTNRVSNWSDQAEIIYQP
jgi:prepilin-type N-terminal cleavage/methylation domain-containing protein